MQRQLSDPILACGRTCGQSRRSAGQNVRTTWLIKPMTADTSAEQGPGVHANPRTNLRDCGQKTWRYWSESPWWRNNLRTQSLLACELADKPAGLRTQACGQPR